MTVSPTPPTTIVEWRMMTKIDPSSSPSGGTAHDSRVAAFQADLANAELRDVIRKHITTGDPVILDRDTYYQLRRAVADKFGLHPSSVILVGSCRTGFSLKPEKRYAPVSPSSDVDVAVVSPGLFDSYWDSVFQRSLGGGGWINSGGNRGGKRFISDLFKGWITPRDLPNLPSFSDGRVWAEFFDGLIKQRTCGYRTISARLYRSWERLEAYQRIMVSHCRNDLRKGKQ